MPVPLSRGLPVEAYDEVRVGAAGDFEPVEHHAGDGADARCIYVSPSSVYLRNTVGMHSKQWVTSRVWSDEIRGEEVDEGFSVLSDDRVEARVNAV
jgi:hypothetical protein